MTGPTPAPFVTPQLPPRPKLPQEKPTFGQSVAKAQATAPQAQPGQPGPTIAPLVTESPFRSPLPLTPATFGPKGDPALDKTLDGMAKGKSLENASKEAGFKNGDDAYKAFQSTPGYKATQTGPSSAAADIRKTSVTDPKGRTVTEYYDFQHDGYHTEVKGAGGAVTVNPERNAAGWKITAQYDSKTKAITTRLENDLGGGEIKETTRLESGTKVEVDTDGGGKSTSTVTSENGTKTTFDGKFDPAAQDPKAILDAVHKDKTGLSGRDIAAFQVAGYDVKTSTGSSGDSTTTIADPKTGKTVVTATDNSKNGNQSVSFEDKGATVTRLKQTDGSVVENTTNKYGVEYREVTGSDGRRSLTVDGQAVDPANLLKNGTAKITLPNGEAGAILPNGQKVAFGPQQDGSGDYGAFIDKSLADGQSIDLIANRFGWSRDQVVAELYLNGAEDVSVKQDKAGKLGVDGPGLPAATDVTLVGVTRDGVTLNSLTTPRNDGKPFQYEVKKNDDLWTIAEKNGLTVEQLLANKANAKLADGHPDTIQPGDKLTIENGTKTEVSYSFAKDDLKTSGPTRAGVADGGQVTLKARPGETAKTIAAEHPWLTPQDVLAANPHLKDGKIRPGDTVVIPDSARLAAMKGEAETRGRLTPADTDVLTNKGAQFDAQDDKGNFKTPGAAQLVYGLSDEIAYATRRSAVPGDALPGLTNDLKARRPGDKAWAAAVDLAAKRAQTTWAAQGRTEAVMGPMYDLANPTGGDVQKFKDHVKGLYRAAAAADPTPEAIRQAEANLLAYGPQDSGSQQAIKDATQDFLVNDPKAKAAEIQKAYDDGGARNNPAAKAAAGAKKLAELTDPKTTDPLSAGLIMKAAQPTVDKIAADLKPYDFDKVLSLYASDVSFVKQEGSSAAQAYSDLSAASTSASRSTDGQKAVSRLASQLKDRDLVAEETGGSLINGGGVALSLEIAHQLRSGGDAGRAGLYEKSALQAINDYEKRTIGLGNDLGRTAAPKVIPEEDWKPFLEDGKAPGDDWFKDQGALDKMASLTKDIDDSSRWLELAYQDVERHAGDLKGSPSEQDLLAKTDPSKMDPQLRLLFNTSPAAAVENLRRTNQSGLAGGALEQPTIIPEWSWPARIVRNTAVNGIDARFGTRPTGAGLALFGLGTYAIGTNNKTQEGGKSYVTAGLYFAGGLTEAWSAVGQFSRNQLGWRTTDAAWWKRQIAAGGESPAFKLAFNAPLRALGWWNAYNSLASLKEGEVVPALLHGAAAGGIFAATSPFTGGENALIKVLGYGKWVKFGGNVVTLIASTGLAVYDMHEKRKPIENLADKHKDYLKAAGVNPDVADALGILPGDDGVGIAPRLVELAKYRHTTPQEILKYLNDEKPRDVFDLAYAAAYVKAGDDGSFSVGAPNPAWETKPQIKADFRPANIAELNQFVDTYLPDFPGQTP